MALPGPGPESGSTPPDGYDNGLRQGCPDRGAVGAETSPTHAPRGAVSNAPPSARVRYLLRNPLKDGGMVVAAPPTVLSPGSASSVRPGAGVPRHQPGATRRPRPSSDSRHLRSPPHHLPLNRRSGTPVRKPRLCSVGYIS
ncbi:MAG: hypothetical protein AVDCRST_MAG19-3418 [uncultured Thermomicrobiales bacterium]|uniref:Uncharacterized protein n=1 Tax=uncultured Thermomicrobiales bacterium TaxID=1645740 RepID=A0A6J4VHH2_9BACT|nr:MAG: hypothetical protein AVDCRST_MAG19-3418 [uncultured Thermomicrobiales bacterium]